MKQKKTKWPKSINVRLTQTQYEHLGKCKSRAVRKLITADMSRDESFLSFMNKAVGPLASL